jgi:hypothetical protein
MLGLHIHGILQNPFKQRRRCGDHKRTARDQGTNKNTTRAIIGSVKHDEDFCYHNKPDQGDCTVFYRP